MSGWADEYVKKLLNHETVSFRPRGNSMLPRIKSGQLVTVEPRTIADGYIRHVLFVDDVVLVKVKGRVVLHKIGAITRGHLPQHDRIRIENQRGHVNGWVGEKSIYGVALELRT